ncbi:hypothetical protein G9A89_013297 [Geosiphon pyriformis]|nr:hypothetical protein G9A89_013297 [Geosiphon pyriformis]
MIRTARILEGYIPPVRPRRQGPKKKRIKRSVTRSRSIKEQSKFSKTATTTTTEKPSSNALQRPATTEKPSSHALQRPATTEKPSSHALQRPATITSNPISSKSEILLRNTVELLPKRNAILTETQKKNERAVFKHEMSRLRSQYALEFATVPKRSELKKQGRDMTKGRGLWGPYRQKHKIDIKQPDIYYKNNDRYHTNINNYVRRNNDFESSFKNRDSIIETPSSKREAELHLLDKTHSLLSLSSAHKFDFDAYRDRKRSQGLENLHNYQSKLRDERLQHILELYHSATHCVTLKNLDTVVNHVFSPGILKRPVWTTLQDWQADLQEGGGVIGKRELEERQARIMDVWEGKDAGTGHNVGFGLEMVKKWEKINEERAKFKHLIGEDGTGVDEWNIDQAVTQQTSLPPDGGAENIN